MPRGSLIFYSVHALHLTDPALLPRGAKALVVAAAAAPGGGGGERQDDAAARRERQKLARGITGTSGEAGRRMVPDCGCIIPAKQRVT